MAMNGKYASILAELAMGRNLKDTFSIKMNKKDLEELPKELQIVGRAILNEDRNNEEAAAYIDWANSLKHRSR
jgi:hypothetical protein